MITNSLKKNFVLLSRIYTVLYHYSRKKIVKYCKYIYVYSFLLKYN